MKGHSFSKTVKQKEIIKSKTFIYLFKAVSLKAKLKNNTHIYTCQHWRCPLQVWTAVMTEWQMLLVHFSTEVSCWCSNQTGNFRPPMPLITSLIICISWSSYHMIKVHQNPSGGEDCATCRHRSWCGLVRSYL